MPLPNTQALSSKTFTAARHVLEDSTSTLLDLYEWNATHNPDHPLFCFHDGTRVRTILWREASLAIYRAAIYFTSQARAVLGSGATGYPQVVAVLASTDTITYFCSIVGILQAGFTVFPISPRNGAAAVAHLLKRTQTACIFTSEEPRIIELATAALAQLPSKHESVKILAMPVFEDLFPSTTETEPVKAVFCWRYPSDVPMIILHSSGSTAFPKPVSWSAQRFKQWALIPWFGNIDFTGIVMGCHAMPMFHGMGVLQINSAASCGVVIATFKPSLPSIFPTPANVLEGAILTNSQFTSCVPAFIENWASDPAKVAYLKTLTGVIFGGGPLSRQTGDRLASEGIALYQNYGCTEASVMNVFLPKNPGTDWDYLEMSTQLKPEFIPYGDGIYELVLIADDTWKPAIINTKVGNFDAYATRDLFISHETKPNLWKIYGRADDQIMLSTGEKTNPGPLESILMQDSYIKSAVIFGRGKSHNGVLIDPQDGLDFESLEVDKSEQFKCTIWPTIERMNAFAPQHSRIFKEMIIVASPSIPFTYTAKGTARRQAIIADYEAEINNLYATLDGNVQAASAIPKPCTWVYEETLPYIRHIVRSTLTREVNDDVDIFRYGCDSLQAMWIRNRILHALQETSNASTNLSPNCVFDAPSVAALAKYVSDVVASVTHVHSSVEHHVALLQAFVSKYTSGFLSRPPSLHDRPKSRDTILLTGSTGGFGCHILADLLTDSSVDKVYALNRKPGDLQRQSAAMRKQGLDETLLNSPKLCVLESDLQDVMLGLDRSKYEEIQTSLTHIIHNAWKVDFNHNVASFDEILASVRNLVNLALSSPYTEPPHLLFTSSIGVFRQTQTKDYLLEEHNRDPNVVVGIGYTEAKWVAERILEEAQHKTGLRTTVVRLGQLCGARNGYWNEREWFPAVVQSAEYLHCLPDVEGAGTISWIPSAEASKALLEMRNTHEEVLHLVHPHPIPWRTFMDPISTLLRVPLVPYATWLAKLEAAALYAQDRRIDEMQGMHALRLLDFFRNVDQSDRKEPLGVARLSVAKALLEAPSLSIMSGLDTGWAARWIKSWKEIGLLHDWRAADCYL